MNSKYTGQEVENLLGNVENLSSTYYTQTQVDAKIANIHNVHTEIVTELPENGDTSIIYLISKGESGVTGNLYDEYIYTNGAYEHVGDFGVDLSGYVTETELSNKGYLTAHQDISGKADKSDTYTKEEVNGLLNNLTTFKTEIVESLPETGDTKTIYFVPRTTEETNNIYDEYIYLNSKWEIIGSTSVAFTDYEKKAWVGTTAEYNALETKDTDRLYILTDGTAGSSVIDLSIYETSEHAAETYQPKGDYLTEHQSLADYAKTEDVNTALAGKSNTGHTHTLSEITDYTAPTIPTKVSELENDSNYLTEHQTLKTINNQSLIGEGNITIEGGTGGGTTYTAGTDISIEDGVISFTGTSANNVYTKTEVDTALEGKSNTGHTHTVSEITDYTAPTTYTAGDGIDISEGVISVTGGSSSEGVSQDNFDSATQAIAASLLSIEKLEENIKADVKNDHYTKEQADEKFVDNDELADEIVEYMKTDAYKQVHEPIEHAIAAALLHLDERVTIVEGNSIAYTAGTDISIEEGVISFTGTIPTKTSDLTNDSNYLIEHQSLDNYYTQEQVNNLIAAISEINISIVTELAETGDARTIYFVPKTTSEEQNVYDEYMYINEAWEKIGDTKVDLTDYVKKESLPDNVVGGTSAYTITKLTQAEYDALEAKDDNTIYFIED